MKEGIQVSIITPTFNSEKTVEKTIRSVINQGYQNIQYILIDGGSTDGTMEIVNKYRSRISIVVSERDRGISDAFNKGIKLSEGDIIGIINSDDELLIDAIDMLAREYDNMSEIFCGSIIAKGKRGYQIQHPDRNIDSLRERMPIPHPATFITRAAYDKYGVYDLSYKASMDRELLLRMYINGATFQFSDTCFTLFNCGEGISTADPSLYNYPEDEAISIKYGLNEKRAKEITKKKGRILRRKKMISKVIDLFDMWSLVNKLTKVKISDKELGRIGSRAT